MTAKYWTFRNITMAVMWMIMMMMMMILVGWTKNAAASGVVGVHVNVNAHGLLIVSTTIVSTTKKFRDDASWLLWTLTVQEAAAAAEAAEAAEAAVAASSSNTTTGTKNNNLNTDSSIAMIEQHVSIDWRYFHESSEWLGEATSTFVVPLEAEPYGGSGSGSGSSSGSSHHQSRTWIVTLWEQLPLSNNNSTSTSTNNKILLTRRLATLPRHSHSRHSRFDPVARVSLFYYYDSTKTTTTTTTSREDIRSSSSIQTTTTRSTWSTWSDYFLGWAWIVFLMFLVVLAGKKPPNHHDHDLPDPPRVIRLVQHGVFFEPPPNNYYHDKDKDKDENEHLEQEGEEQQHPNQQEQDYYDLSPTTTGSKPPPNNYRDEGEHLEQEGRSSEAASIRHLRVQKDDKDDEEDSIDSTIIQEQQQQESSSVVATSSDHDPPLPPPEEQKHVCSTSRWGNDNDDDDDDDDKFHPLKNARWINPPPEQHCPTKNTSNGEFLPPKEDSTTATNVEPRMPADLRLSHWEEEDITNDDDDDAVFAFQTAPAAASSSSSVNHGNQNQQEQDYELSPKSKKTDQNDATTTTTTTGSNAPTVNSKKDEDRTTNNTAGSTERISDDTTKIVEKEEKESLQDTTAGSSTPKKKQRTRCSSIRGGVEENEDSSSSLLDSCEFVTGVPANPEEKRTLQEQLSNNTTLWNTNDDGEVCCEETCSGPAEKVVQDEKVDESHGTVLGVLDELESRHNSTMNATPVEEEESSTTRDKLLLQRTTTSHPDNPSQPSSSDSVGRPCDTVIPFQEAASESSSKKIALSEREISKSCRSIQDTTTTTTREEEEEEEEGPTEGNDAPVFKIGIINENTQGKMITQGLFSSPPIMGDDNVPKITVDYYSQPNEEMDGKERPCTTTCHNDNDDNSTHDAASTTMTLPLIMATDDVTPKKSPTKRIMLGDDPYSTTYLQPATTDGGSFPFSFLSSSSQPMIRRGEEILTQFSEGQNFFLDDHDKDHVSTSNNNVVQVPPQQPLCQGIGKTSPAQLLCCSPTNRATKQDENERNHEYSYETQLVTSHVPRRREATEATSNMNNSPNYQHEESSTKTEEEILDPSAKKSEAMIKDKNVPTLGSPDRASVSLGMGATQAVKDRNNQSPDIQMAYGHETIKNESRKRTRDQMVFPHGSAMSPSKKIDNSGNFVSESRTVKIQRDLANETGSTAESYVSTLPPDSDYVTEESLFSPAEGQSWAKQSSKKVSCTSPSSMPRNNVNISSSSPIDFENRCKTPPEVKDASQESLSHVVTSSRRSNRLGERNVSTELLTGDTLPAFSNLKSPKRKRKGARSLISCIQIMKKSKESSPSQEKCHRRLDTDPELVEIVHVSLSTSTTKKRIPFQNSSIIPDWVPSNGLQSISQQFMEDEPWDVSPGTNKSNKILVPKSILLPGSSKIDK